MYADIFIWVILLIVLIVVAWTVFPHIVDVVSGGLDYSGHLKYAYLNDLINTPHKTPKDAINDKNHYYSYKFNSYEYILAWNEDNGKCSIHWNDIYSGVKELKREREIWFKRGPDGKFQWLGISGLHYNVLDDKLKKALIDYCAKRQGPEWASVSELLKVTTPVPPPVITVRTSKLTESYATTHESVASIVTPTSLVELKFKWMTDNFAIIEYWNIGREIKTLVVPKKKLLQSDASYMASLAPLFTFIKDDFKPLVHACMGFDQKNAKKLWAELCWYMGNVSHVGMYAEIQRIVTGK